MSDRIAVMMGGQILQCAAPDVIYDDPDTIEVAEFIGSPKINILPAEVSDTGRLSLLDQPLNLVARRQKKGAVSVGLRPEALRLAGEEAPIRGHVIHAENLGAEAFVQLEVPPLGHPITFRAQTSEWQSLALGSPVGLDFDPDAVLVFGTDGLRIRDVLQPQPKTAEAV